MIHLAADLSPLALLGAGYGIGLVVGALCGVLATRVVLRWREP